MGGVVDSVVEDDYEELDGDRSKTLNREWDCVMVFERGTDEEWDIPDEGINYDYIKTLDPTDINKRKALFAQHRADFVEQRAKVRDFFRNETELVAKAMSRKGLVIRRIVSMETEDNDEYDNKRFYYVGIPERVAREAADRFGYELELEATSAITYLHLMDEPLANATFDTDLDNEHVGEHLWRNIYVPFANSVSPDIYKARDILSEMDEKEYDDSLFRIRDRCAIINEIVSADTQEGGCGIHVPHLQAKNHCLCEFFPLHSQDELDYMYGRLFSLDPRTWLSLPLHEFREYFGEYIAIYFAFLQFHNKYLLPATIVGLGIGAVQFVMGEILITGIAYFGLAIAIWMLCFPLLWRRTEFEWAMKWGTLRFDMQERSRPEFDGIYMRSTVDGSMEEYYPTAVRNQKRLLSFGIVATFLVALFGSVVAIVLLRVYVANTDIEYGSYYISIANALVIMFFNTIYGKFAEIMNSWENYRTETEYENNLILKVFVFRFINSYASLYYLAFFRAFEDEDSSLYCSPEKCMEHLRSQLAIIFLTQIVVSNSIELGELAAKRLAEGGVHFGEETEGSKIWNEFTLEPYGRSFDDYNEILVSLGYCTLFVMAFPLAPLLGFISGVVESRIDGYKMCRLQRRPFPRHADDIGMWQLALELMGWAVLVTNLALMCFVTDELVFSFGIGDDWLQEILTAIAIFCVVIIIEYGMAFVYKKAPKPVTEHIAREAHLESMIKERGDSIMNHINSEEELSAWKTWKVPRILNYLHEVLLTNSDEYQLVEQVFQDHRIDGKNFAILTENDLEGYGVDDFEIRHFIIHTRSGLEEQVLREEREEATLAEVDAINTRRMMGGPTLIGTGSGGAEVFQFRLDHMIALASYLESDLTGQTKRKLWKRVDKDDSGLVEKDEMGAFLYFAIALYIKSKYPHSRLPSRDDPILLKKIINPCRHWLLQFKINPRGLTFEEFSHHFSTWLREFHAHFRLMQHQAATPVVSSSSKDFSLMVSGEVAAAERLATIGEISIQPRNEWSPVAREWETKLGAIAQSIKRASPETRGKIWDRFDRNRKQKIDTEKTLLKMIFAMIVLYIKTHEKKTKEPSMKELQPMLQLLGADISRRLPGDGRTMARNDFVNNISRYLLEIAQQRQAELRGKK